MATHALTTPIVTDTIDESLNSARWFLTRRRFVMALETLRSAAVMCRDDRRQRIQALADALGNAPIVSFAL